VSVRVRLHDSTHRDDRPNMLLDSPKILPQRGKRNVRPCRARCRSAQDLCSASHFRDYKGSSPNPEVTLGLLPTEFASFPGAGN
jgi:hypothetical protein